MRDADDQRIMLGWFLLCLPRSRQIDLGTVCAEEDPVSLRSGVRFTGVEGSGGLQSVHHAEQHHSFH